MSNPIKGVVVEYIMTTASVVVIVVITDFILILFSIVISII